MEYVVYCDESRHDGADQNRFMSIGSLWLPRSKKPELTKQFRALRESVGLKGEVKWSKVSEKKLEAYRKLVDFFFDQPDLRFRVIVVDQSEVDLKRFHGGDRELGFYKFYFEMLEKWIESGNRYLGLVHSSAAPDLPTLIINRLRQDGDIETGISPQFLVRNWPAMKEWPTKSVRDAFFASPKFPRLLNVEAVRQAIQNGVANGFFAYVGKTAQGDYSPFIFNHPLMTGDIELSEEMYLVKKDDADQYQKTKAKPPEPKPEVKPEPGKEPEKPKIDAVPIKSPERLTLTGLAWEGEIPPQKWMNFYTKVLSKFAASQGLKLKLKVEVKPEEGLSKQRLEETKAALRELGLSDNVEHY